MLVSPYATHCPEHAAALRKRQSRPRPPNLPDLVPDTAKFDDLETWLRATLVTLETTVEELSEWCGLAFSAMYEWLNDPHKPLALSSQHKLHDALGAPLEELERLRPSAQARHMARQAAVETTLRRRGNDFFSSQARLFRLNETDRLTQQAYAALRRHDPDKWYAYEQCVINEESQTDVAKTLGITQSGVAMRVKRAKALIELYKSGSWYPPGTTVQAAPVGTRRRYKPRQCEECPTWFEPTTPTQRRCKNCTWMMTHDICSCGRQKDKDAAHCRECNNDILQQEAQEYVQWLAAGGGDNHIPDALGTVILAWMAEEGHTFKSAGEALQWQLTHFYQVVCPWLRKVGSVSRSTLVELAERLGRISARGWDTNRWTQELLAVPLTTRCEKREEVWAREYVATLPDTHPFADALRDRIVVLNLTRKQSSQVMGVSPDVVSMWLTRGRRPTNRPRLHQMAAVARLWIEREGDTAQLEAAMTQICQLLWEKTPCSAGLLVLRKMSYQSMTMKALRARTKRDGKSVVRLIWEGVATAATRLVVADALELSPGDRQQFLDQVQILPPPQHEKAIATMLRNRRWKKISSSGRQRGQQVKKRKGEERRLAFQDLFDKYAERGLNPRSRNLRRYIRDQVGGSPNDEQRAYDEWIMSRSDTN